MAITTGDGKASYSIGEQYKELLAKISQVTRRPRTEVVRIMIDEKAIELGLTPVREQEEADK
jgi:hypothetical protein